MKSPTDTLDPTPSPLRPFGSVFSAPRCFVSRSNLQVQRNQSFTPHPRFKTRKSFIALLLPHFFPVSPLLHHSYKKIGGGGYPHLPASLPPCLLASFFCSRPYPPLSKSFVFNTVMKTLQKAPLSNSFRFRWFQTSCKVPLRKSLPAGRQASESHSYINIIFLWQRALCVCAFCTPMGSIGADASRRDDASRRLSVSGSGCCSYAGDDLAAASVFRVVEMAVGTAEEFACGGAVAGIAGYFAAMALKLPTAAGMLSNVGMTSSSRVTLSASCTRPAGHTRRRLPLLRVSPVHCRTSALMPELSIWMRPLRSTTIFLQPSAASRCSSRSKSSLFSPSVARPRGSITMMSPSLRVVISSL